MLRLLCRRVTSIWQRPSGLEEEQGAFRCCNSHVTMIGVSESLLSRIALKPCVAFTFAYVSRRPRSVDDLPGTIHAQLRQIVKFSRAHSYDIIKTIAATLSNRDRHFAETVEFRAAVQAEVAADGPLVVGSMFTLLSTTSPKKILTAIEAALTSDVIIIDAATEAPIASQDLARLAKQAIAAAEERRAPIRRGLKQSRVKRSLSPGNQAKAAQGASHAAEAYALRIKPVVDELRQKLPIGSDLGPTALARELNRRGVVTRRGNRWSATTATDLLARLDQISQSD